MGRVGPIPKHERDAAEEAALRRARELVGTESGYIHPQAKYGQLSDFEMRKVVMEIISGWIIERSKQLCDDRFGDEAHLLATGEIPEPMELGACAVCLPALGDLVEKLGLSDVPVGAWSRDNILLFVWTAAELVTDARTRRDERPGPSLPSDEARSMMAG